MEVSFGTQRLQRTCESAIDMRRTYGSGCATKLMLRLTELRSAPTLEDLRHLGGRCHELDDARTGYLAVDLGDGRTLVFRPAGGWPRRKGRGARDWRSVDAIEVIEIVTEDDE
jgi:proteic killer suppression protein